MSDLTNTVGVTRTRLHPSDRARLLKLAKSRELSEASMARFGLVWFLDHFEDGDIAQTESAYVEQVKSSTNRICAFLAKMAADLRALYCFVGEDDPESIKRWRVEAQKQIARALSPDDTAIARRLSEIVQEPDDAQRPQT